MAAARVFAGAALLRATFFAGAFFATRFPAADEARGFRASAFSPRSCLTWMRSTPRVADDAIKTMAKADDNARRLMSIPGIGPVTASAIAASVQDVSSFSGSREFSAYLGLTPRQNSSGGKERLGRVSKIGNRYLRKLLVVGANAVLYNRKGNCRRLASLGAQADGDQALQAGRGGARQQGGADRRRGHARPNTILSEGSQPYSGIKPPVAADRRSRVTMT